MAVSSSNRIQSPSREPAGVISGLALLIAHGRGEQSATPARLKSYVAHWLGQLPQVIAYASADRRHGGTGAVLVLVKKSAEAKEETRQAYGQKSDPE